MAASSASLAAINRARAVSLQRRSSRSSPGLVVARNRCRHSISLATASVSGVRVGVRRPQRGHQALVGAALQPIGGDREGFERMPRGTLASAGHDSNPRYSKADATNPGGASEKPDRCLSILEIAVFAERTDFVDRRCLDDWRDGGSGFGGIDRGGGGASRGGGTRSPIEGTGEIVRRSQIWRTSRLLGLTPILTRSLRMTRRKIRKIGDEKRLEV